MSRPSFQWQCSKEAFRDKSRGSGLMSQLQTCFHYSTCIFIKKTLSKALRTQALTASTSKFGLIWWVGFGVFGSVGLLARFGLAGLLW